MTSGEKPQPKEESQPFSEIFAPLETDIDRTKRLAGELIADKLFFTQEVQAIPIFNFEFDVNTGRTKVVPLKIVEVYQLEAGDDASLSYALRGDTGRSIEEVMEMIPCPEGMAKRIIAAGTGFVSGPIKCNYNTASTTRGDHLMTLRMTQLNPHAFFQYETPGGGVNLTMAEVYLPE